MTYPWNRTKIHRANYTFHNSGVKVHSARYIVHEFLAKTVEFVQFEEVKVHGILGSRYMDFLSKQLNLSSLGGQGTWISYQNCRIWGRETPSPSASKWLSLDPVAPSRFKPLQALDSSRDFYGNQNRTLGGNINRIGGDLSKSGVCSASFQSAKRCGIV